MQPSRRAFLFGRQTPRTPWEAFLQRLQRQVQGGVRTSARDREDSRCARLAPLHREDVRQARALCAEYGVGLQLLCSPSSPGADTTGGRDDSGAALNHDQPILQIDPVRLNALACAPHGQSWQAEPGCLVGDLVDAGLTQLRDAPSEWTLATWLASSSHWASGATDASGVVEIDVLLSDGTAEQLGPFGATDLRPLRSATIQRLVPTLFQLSMSPDAIICRESRAWPCGYRLDALSPTAPAEVNLAQLLLGHGGTLAWVESVTLRPAEAIVPDPSCANVICTEQVTHAAQRLQGRIKQAFDPRGLFCGRTDSEQDGNLSF